MHVKNKHFLLVVRCEIALALVKFLPRPRGTAQKTNEVGVKHAYELRGLSFTLPAVIGA